jgi:hexosaminidase
MDSETPTGFVSELRSLGYAVLPSPRSVTLDGGTIRLDGGWGILLSKVRPDDIALKTLTVGFEEELGIRIAMATKRTRELVLGVRSGAVKTGLDDGRDAQAYAIEISQRRIAVIGNGKPGLFYGVQTLLQMVEGNGHERGLLPACHIVDWPEYELRCMHLDTKHHQDRPETMRRYLDQAARFKINAVLYELEDKFAYPSHPVIGAPGAWTAEELKGLVDYGLRRHIQLIPDVQSPAHMGYVLKHKEFESLRCDGSNYQICMDEPDARQLLFDMYDDVCDATKGVEFFHVSTDEVYYAGICEKFRKPYNPENRSLTWVDYVNAAHAHLADKGRRVIVWGEYPLLPEHVKMLPKDLLNGVGGHNARRTEAEDQHGIRQFQYVSMQGVELLFPNYFAYTDRDGLCQPGRLGRVTEDARRGHETMKRCIGTITAAWDDSGLHNETFWLGWVMMGQASWTPGTPVEEAVATFFDAFYGRGADGLSHVHLDLQSGARFYENSLERLPSKSRGPAYGSSDEKKPVPRTDRGMVPPALLDPDTLSVEPAFRPRYAKVLAEVPARMAESDRLLLALQSNLGRVRRNRYNLEVYLSLAYLQRHHLDMLLAVAGAEDLLVQAAETAKAGSHEEALALLRSAHQKVQRTTGELETTYQRVKAVWEKSRFPKGQSVDGRRFVHVMDDVKDHTADRTPDLRYLVLPEERIGLRDWLAALEKVIGAYAAAHGLKSGFSTDRPLEE